MKHLGLALGLFFALGSSGCVVVSDGADLYESCFDRNDCNDFDAFCSSITTDWPDGLRSSNSICTWSCIDSLDCPGSNNGNPGLCVDFGGSGSRCYEDCVVDSDCDFGFACGEIGGGFTICLPR